VPTFEERNIGPARGLHFHGYDQAEAGILCSRCSRSVPRAYRISYDGVRAAFTLCSSCFHFAKIAYASRFFNHAGEEVADAAAAAR